MISKNLATTPLLSLDAIAFDSETTGLDTSKARMIELGAVRIAHGQVEKSQCFHQRINPGLPISPASQSFHGISDEDVADAPAFAEVASDFDEWTNNVVLIGYATGFDLAILKREKRLAGMPWQAPRCLDVRFMVNLLAPNLPDFSLDTIANWLDIEIHKRHSALGDAIATATIFIRLIPRLRKLGIRTLAELERACEGPRQASAGEVDIGWEDVNQGRRNVPVFGRIDSFAYRHRLHDLMSSPPRIIQGNLSLHEVLEILVDEKISSIYVQPQTPEGPFGIITERDLLRIVREKGHAALEQSAGEIAQFPLASLAADAFVYRAAARMKRLNVRHLAVHDNHGEIVGALSARDLLRQRADVAILLGDDIDAARNSAEMSAVWGDISLVAKSLVFEDVDARDVAAVVSRELCALTRQACVLAEREMLGAPPCAYAMLVLGSGGRGESLLAMDQDNAIVFAHGKPGGTEDQWFAELGGKVSDMLDAAGVPYCKGNIMASNPDWRRSVEDWQALQHTWITRQSPEDILNCDIFFDAISVHGDIRLANTILDYAYKLGAESNLFLKLMSINACKNSPPLGLFGRFKLDKDRVDLKMGGIMPLFSCARILAIKHGLRLQSTPDRYSGVFEKIEEMQVTFENLNEAHRVILNTILQQQLLDLDAGVPLSNRVAPGMFSAATREQLVWALQQVPNVSNLLGDPLTT